MHNLQIMQSLVNLSLASMTTARFPAMARAVTPMRLVAEQFSPHAPI